MNLTYEEARARAEELNSGCRAAGLVLSGFPKNAMGLTPDAVKATADYVAAKSTYDKAFAAQRAFNGWYTVRFKKERASERAARLIRPVQAASGGIS